MLRYCSYCADLVEAEGHTHPEKKCNTCAVVKKLDQFPPSNGSLDKHRHTCKACLDVLKSEKRQQSLERLQKREVEKALLTAYGYWWKKETVHSTWEEPDGWGGWDEDEETREQWVLHRPGNKGKSIDKNEAIAEIHALQVHHPGHPVTLWAKDVLARNNVVILDTETTGIGDADEIIELAIVDTQGKTRVNSLMQCQMQTIPLPAKKVHGISEQLLKAKGRHWPDVWEQLITYLTSKVIIIYNAEYDLRMLRQTAKRYGFTMPELNVCCLMEKYSEYVGAHTESGYVRSMRLSAACSHFQVSNDSAHRALDDCQASLSVLKGLAQHAEPHHYVRECCCEHCGKLYEQLYNKAGVCDSVPHCLKCYVCGQMKPTGKEDVKLKPMSRGGYFFVCEYCTTNNLDE
ncbi:MAG TPA: 3'-5' exonuclease [Ktedonobacteraceae bacterium]